MPTSRRTVRWMHALMLPALLALPTCGTPGTRKDVMIGRAEERTRADAARPENTEMHPPTEYSVSLRSPQTQTATITMTVREVKGDSLDVALPVWRPGRYQVLDQAGSISAFAATNSRGEPLAATKLDKATWRISTGGSEVVRVSYRVYANSLNDRTRHIDDTHAFLSPAAVFVYAPERRFAPVRVTIDAPDGWSTSTGLERENGSRTTFVGVDYDVLVDSPLEIGVHDFHEFEVDGVPHEIIVWHGGAAASEKPRYDAEKFTRDFAAIVRTQVELFGDMPYSRYVFQIHAGPGLGGGTEHLNSTIMQTSRATFEEEGAYKRFLGLVSHEMFHTWNVKQLRPADLKPYDYAHEDYTRLLWLVEGATSYYDDLCLVRAGLMSADAYIAMVEGMINSEIGRPGWREQSLEDSSFDAWIKFNKATPDAVNSTVSFYGKGSLISLLLDMEIRTRTANQASLDTVMRRMYERFPLKGPGYTTRDVLNVLREVCEEHRSAAVDSKGTAEGAKGGTNERAADCGFDDFFARYIAGTETPDFTRLFDVVGLTCELDAIDESEPYLGLTLVEKEGKTLVSAVLADGPAFRAGLMADDEIVAMNGRRLKKDDLDKRVGMHDAGDTLTFTFFRREELREIDVKLDAAKKASWTVKRRAAPTDEQRVALREWLRQK